MLVSGLEKQKNPIGEGQGGGSSSLCPCVGSASVICKCIPALGMVADSSTLRELWDPFIPGSTRLWYTETPWLVSSLPWGLLPHLATSNGTAPVCLTPYMCHLPDLFFIPLHWSCPSFGVHEARKDEHSTFGLWVPLCVSCSPPRWMLAASIPPPHLLLVTPHTNGGLKGRLFFV